MSDTSNILLAASRPHVTNCIIIRMDNSDWMVAVEDDVDRAEVRNVVLHGMVPTLWGWLKLWWQTRSTRRNQRLMTKGAIVDRSFVAQPFDRLYQQ